MRGLGVSLFRGSSESAVLIQSFSPGWVPIGALLFGGDLAAANPGLKDVHGACLARSVQAILRPWLIS